MQKVAEPLKAAEKEKDQKEKAIQESRQREEPLSRYNYIQSLQQDADSQTQSHGMFITIFSVFGGFLGFFFL